MIGDLIADSLNLCLTYTERLLKDVRADQFGRFANIGGSVVQSNHPAFVLGHLALYAPRILGDLGRGDGGVVVPEPFQAVFSRETVCQDDASGTLYPPMDEIVQTYFSGYRAAQAALRETADDVFQRENPNEAMRKRFSTLGSMHAFYCSGHMMVHLGQMSAWRRMVGLAPA